MEHNRRLLVVDDHRGIHDDVRKLLAPTPPSPADDVEETLFGVAPVRPETFEIDSAYQGEEGASMVRQARLEGRPYALAIVDMRMPPGWDGLQTVEQMWDVDPELQVVICSAYSDASWQDISRRFDSRHRLLILKKPFDPIELCQMAVAMAEKWHLAQQAQLRFEELSRMVDARTRDLQEAHEALRRSSETELAKRGAELARSLALAHEIQEAVVDGILVIDEFGKVVTANRRFCELWGIPAGLIASGDDQDLLGHAITQLVDPDRFLSRVRYLYEHPTESGAEDIRLTDGRVFERWTGPVHGAGGATFGRVWCFRDVTERRRLDDARLLVTERMASMGRIAASVGHEINNPLAYVTGNIEWLARVCSGSEAAAQLPSGEIAEVVEATREGLQRIRAIVGDLQSLTRGGDEVRTVTDVASLLDYALQLASTEIRHRAQVVRQFEPGAGVMGSPTRLGQLFLNLFVNAAHAVPEGSANDHVITVRSRTEGQTVVVEVCDTGVGISEEHLERVFDPFFTTKDLGKGSGLGLSICKGIVEEHGGTLDVVSSPGAGSTFVVTLPRAFVQAPERASVQAVATPGTTSPTTRQARVLAIDDEPLLLTMLSRLLSGRHAVVTVTDARQALTYLRKGETFDVIFCDLIMKDMTGMDFRDVVVREFPALTSRIVFMTGGAFMPRAAALVESATAKVIAKPFNFPEVFDVIDWVVSRHA